MKKGANRIRREPVLSSPGESDPPSEAVASAPTLDGVEGTDRREGGLLGPADREIHPGPLEAAAPDSAIHPGPLEPSTAGEIHPGPLDPSSTSEVHVGPLERSSHLGESALVTVEARPEPQVEAGHEKELAATAAFETPIVVEVENAPRATAVVVAKRKKSWREQRWERRRRRIYFEEALAWVLVPVILIGCYIGAKGILSAFGTTPTALIQGIQTALSSRP